MVDSGDGSSGFAALRLRFERSPLLRLEPGSIPAIHNLALIALERRAFGLSAAWLAKGLALAPTDAGLRKLRTLWWWRRATRSARRRRA